MRSWDRGKPKDGLSPRPKHLQKAQLSRTVRGVKSVKPPPQHHPHDWCYQRQPQNIQWIWIVRDNETFYLAKAGGIGVLCRQYHPVVLSRIILRGDAKTRVIGLASRFQTALRLEPSPIAHQSHLPERLIYEQLPLRYQFSFIRQTAVRTRKRVLTAVYFEL